MYILKCGTGRVSVQTSRQYNSIKSQRGYSQRTPRSMSCEPWGDHVINSIAERGVSCRRPHWNIKGFPLEKIVFIFLLILFPTWSFAQQQSSEKEKPNILWVCTDQQRWNTIGALGNEFVHTPHLDKLVKNGVAFTRAYVQSPVCTPSRASFLTGMYPSTIHNATNGGDLWNPPFPLITKELEKAGYVCGLSGKLHLSASDGRIEQRTDDGYEELHWSHHPWDSWPEGHDYKEWLEAQGVTYDSLYEKYGYIPKQYHQTKWCTDRAIDFVKKHKNQPWLFSLNIFDPHNPYDPPQEYLDRYDVEEMPGPCFQSSDLAFQKDLDFAYFQTEPMKPEAFDAKLLQAKYWAQIDQIDEHLGRLFEVLEETGEMENTIILFTSDHGDMVGDHGLQKKGCRFYEALVRVPLIFSWPASFKTNLQSNALVELTDIYPTLMEAAGLPVHERVQGKSLMPILTGQASPEFLRPYVRSEYYDALNHEPPNYATMLRTEKYKIVVYHGHELGELYDLENDPCEFNNLWNHPEHAEIKMKLLKLSFDATAKAVDTGPERVGNY